MAADTLRVGDVAICMDCRGAGRSAYGVCARCNGKGCVCPKCSGMRFVRLRHTGHEVWSAEVVRCPTCCEGNQVNEVAEVKAIRAYIDAYIAIADTAGVPALAQKEDQQ